MSDVKRYHADMIEENDIDVRLDRQYIAGAQAGFNCDDHESLNRIIEPRLAEIRARIKEGV